MTDLAAYVPDVFARIDVLNLDDPTVISDGPPKITKELLYGRRMTAWQERLYPDASPALRIACRGQHIARWRIPRADYPMTKPGYKAWRTELARLHAAILGELISDAGGPPSLAERVQFIVRKRKLKVDPESQAMENVVCLVFLEHYFSEFADDHPEEKVVDIVYKTWLKMSAPGREVALTLPLAEREARIVGKALARAKE